MTHLWVRSEQRANEDRVGLTPKGASALMRKGITVTVEESKSRIIPTEAYHAVGCKISTENSWSRAPETAIIFGLKELPNEDSKLHHRHIMFGHAYKGQHSGLSLLRRFKKGNGVLYDLEYLVDDAGRRVAAFGYWAGFSGAAISVLCWIAQQNGTICPPIASYSHQKALIDELSQAIAALDVPLPNAIVIGALGRVGTGAADLCATLGIPVTKWDIAETASGGPFPEILAHTLFFNCILARPGTPVFAPRDIVKRDRALRVIGDIACDPGSDYNPIPVYNSATNWETPAARVASAPPLDVMAIDNLPSLLPLESSEDFAEQLLPYLLELDTLEQSVWGRAKKTFDQHIKGV